MSRRKVSVIIPACNEEKYLKKTIDSIRIQKYSPIEIIVVVNNSKDKTFEIAKRYADKVLNFPDSIGVSAARNRGAGVAQGDIYVFLDADTTLSEGTIEKIVPIVTPNVMGTCRTKPGGKNLLGRLFFGFRNCLHIIKLYKGVGGVFFCHRGIFLRINGFNEKKLIAEFHEFIHRAIEAGARYVCLKDCYVITSLRRFENRGYLGTFWFWVKWRVGFFFKTHDKIAEEYFKIR